jgi:hypothetical protein
MVTLTKKQLQARINNARSQPTARSRPARKPRAAQQVVRRAPNRIPAGLSPNHHFNAFGPSKPQALTFSVGPAVHVSGYGSKNFNVENTTNTMLVFQPGGGRDQLLIYTQSLTTGVWTLASTQNIDSTGITSTPSSTSPDSLMCSRGSMRVRNFSRAADSGGLIKVLRLSTGFDLTLQTPAVLDDMIHGNARTRAYTGSSLTQSHQWDCIPVSQDKYHAFTAVNTALGEVLDPAVSSTVIYFASTAVTNNYEVTFAATYYCRYRFIGPLTNMAANPPTIPIAKSNMLRDIAESVGSAGRLVGNAIGAEMTSVAKEVLPGYLGNLVRQGMGGGLAAGRSSAITGIEEIGSLALL